MVNTFVFSTCLYLFKEIIKKKLSGYEFFFVFSSIFVEENNFLKVRSEKQEARDYLLS